MDNQFMFQQPLYFPRNGYVVDAYGPSQLGDSLPGPSDPTPLQIHVLSRSNRPPRLSPTRTADDEICEDINSILAGQHEKFSVQKVFMSNLDEVLVCFQHLDSGKMAEFKIPLGSSESPDVESQSLVVWTNGAHGETACHFHLRRNGQRLLPCVEEISATHRRCIYFHSSVNSGFDLVEIIELPPSHDESFLNHWLNELRKGDTRRRV